MHCRIALAVLIVTVATPGYAQLPPGYSRDTTVILPDSLNEVSRGGRFRISITRQAASDRERELIAIAESLIPPRDSIEAAASKLTGSGWVNAFAEAKLRPGPRWWWRKWDLVWLPYALTGQAISEYITNVRTLSTSSNPFARHNPGVDHRASLEYTAHVRALPNTEGHRVDLAVRYRFFCGPLCALSFSHARVVILDAKGVVVRVEGDQPPRAEVS
jgi:hypothetical protein